MNEFDPREESLFNSALEISPGEAREQFLEEACQDDADLRDRVARLLAMHESNDCILDDTVHGVLENTANIGLKPGDVLGPYRLIEQIGEGGMGIVYLAEQTEPICRRVAVKIVKVGMDTRSVIARFEVERQALAMMDHPCITRVLDAGTTDAGRPYFVMELVEGQSITAYCDERKMPIEDRVKLFIRLCQAVQHAHQKGIIHRDIKPSNVLVATHDARPLPKIIDFGIAKAIDNPAVGTRFTGYGELIGTPEYMSPEQAEMSGVDIDTRSDIYSLGVLFYELLTGTTPFHDVRDKGLHEIRESIRTRDPELPSTRINSLEQTVDEVCHSRGSDVRSLNRFLRGDLDWIIMKCLEKDRTERYQAASDVARDLQRHLAGESVEAARPSLAYRAAKFARRHRGGLLVSSVIALALVCTAVTGTVMAVSSQKMAKRALAAERLAEERLERAQRSEARLRELERQHRDEVAHHRAFARYNGRAIEDYVKRLNLAPPRGRRNMFYAQGPSRFIFVDGSGDGDAQTVQIMHSAEANPNTMRSMKVTFPTVNRNVELHADINPHTVDPELADLILEEQKKCFGIEDRVVRRTLLQIADARIRRQEWKDARGYLHECLTIINEAPRREAAEEAQVRCRLASVAHALGDTKAAREELARAQRELKAVVYPPKDLLKRYQAVSHDVLH